MRRTLKILGILFLIILLAAAATGAWLYHRLTGSLPLLEGQVQMGGLVASVTIERDAEGVPTIRGGDRTDVARALGFLHAQERFFQMDLMRRQAAGELAELLGEALVDADRAARLHGFRDLATRVVEEVSGEDRRIMDAYVEGIHQGLAALDEKPFEYLVLGTDPAPWRKEDSVLNLLAMFSMLHDERGERESARGLLFEVLPEELARFLAPPGTEWDAPLVGEPFLTGAIPGPEVLDLREEAVKRPAARFQPFETPHELVAGSNNWAVAGFRSRNGGALLANDMHLGISVPNTWYRAVLEWPDEDGSLHRIAGVTLPGTPALVAGSNTHVAWGFTNSQGDWVDLVIVERDANDPELYRTPEGDRRFERRVETIQVRDSQPVTLEVRETIWGPIVDQDHHGRPRAVRWTAHQPHAVNMNLLELEHARTLEEAQSVANRCGIPPQNFVCADATGRVGWTIAGIIPRRIGFDGRTPTSWAEGTRSWDGWLEPEAYPRVVDPESGIIWTANARTVDGEMLARLGDGGYDIGARARQIRDRLLELDEASENDMLAVQLDDRALFLARWRDKILEILDTAAVEGHPRRARFRDLVERTWTGRASIDSVAYRLTRDFRWRTFELVYGWLTAACRDADERFRLFALDQWEGPLWKLITEQPIHLLDPRYDSWNEAILSVVDEIIEELEGNDSSRLEDRTWGERNTTAIRHPLSRALPMLSRWLDMPHQPLPGDGNMPRVQGPSHGASERFAVSPGREEEGIFHMPCGQSGHPLSPYYRAGHEAWAKGRATPFLPGATRWILRLEPGPHLLVSP